MHRFVLPLLLGALGCGDGAAADADARAQGDGAVDPAPRFDALAGSVRILERSPIEGGPIGYSSLVGRFADAAAPQLHTETMRAGACRLLRWEAPFCDPPCGEDLCEPGGRCVPQPTAQCAGTLTVSGLREPLSLAPDPLCGYFDDREGDYFEAGVEVAVATTGADLARFELTVRAPAVEDLAVTSAGSPAFPDFQPDRDYTFTWDGADPGSRVRLVMASDAGHGQPAAAIVECDAPDTGALTVPAAILTAYIDPSNWTCGECPPQLLTRYRHATHSLPNGEQVELVVGTEAQFFYWGYRP